MSAHQNDSEALQQILCQIHAIPAQAVKNSASMQEKM
jgi:hypothetical protein